MKVIVHIGPPKTATSAIQRWLQLNTDSLKQKGIYYPEHTLDSNGVSSGNVLNLFDRKEDKTLKISEEKVKYLVSAVKQHKCHTLLLSSEFFFFQIDDLMRIFNKIKFIAYIRFPLNVIESSYNQSVKRHNETKPLGLPKEPKAYHLTLLEKMLKKHGKEHFTVRFYHKALFANGNIVSDFLEYVGVDSIDVDEQVINPSYSFEALELKRWLNCFLVGELQNRIDQLLQSYDRGQESYSLINTKSYEYYREWFYEKLKCFFDEFPFSGHEKYMDLIKEVPQKPYLKQNLSVESFKDIVNFIVDKDVEVVQHLVDDALKNKESLQKRPDFHKVFVNSVPVQFLVKKTITEYYRNLTKSIKRNLFRIKGAGHPPPFLETVDLSRIRTLLQIDDSVSDAEIFREFALFCEQNGDLELAYRMMKQAQILRPHGPVIAAKLAEYQERLNIIELEN